jgi:hypothetical protein
MGARFHSLYGTQYPHAANVRVFAVHVVREDDDLEDVRVYRFAENQNQNCYLFTLRFGQGEGRTTPRRRRLARQRRRT